MSSDVVDRVEKMAESNVVNRLVFADRQNVENDAVDEAGAISLRSDDGDYKSDSDSDRDSDEESVASDESGDGSPRRPVKEEQVSVKTEPEPDGDHNTQGASDSEVSHAEPGLAARTEAGIQQPAASAQGSDSESPPGSAVAYDKEIVGSNGLRRMKTALWKVQRQDCPKTHPSV